MTKQQAEIVDALGSLSHDPVAFVNFAFPWGEKGTPLEHMSGPDKWQVKLLQNIAKGLKSSDEVIREAVASGHGIGKAMDLDAVIDTPAGVKRWGDIMCGDYVFADTGKPTKVVQTKYYESVPMYRVTFDDDTSCDVSSGHLWAVKDRKIRRSHEQEYKVMSTLDMFTSGIYRTNGQTKAKKYSIPMAKPVEYESVKTPITPYLMGVWIVDGTKGLPRYTKPHQEIKDRLLQEGYTLHDGVSHSVYIQGISDAFKAPYFNLSSCDRYIPDVYKYTDSESRKSLLCGLLDTDGEITKGNSIGYSTTSKRLADDILWLVRSLGGKAKRQRAVKKGWYYKDGTKVRCKDCYRLTISLPFNPFSIKHRKERYKPKQDRYLVRWIKDIKPIGTKPAMCISVESNKGLYLANDFIVTHNSAMVAWLILWAISTRENTKGVVTANTEGQLRTKTWPEVAKWYQMFIGKDLFTYTATSIFSSDKACEKTWRIDAIPWSESSPESFAGLHNQGNRILVVFDEASAISDSIWEVTEGALTDDETEIIWCAFGNPTRNTGRFRECFRKQRHRWSCQQIDSRTVAISNKQQLNQWVEDYGEDSDFVKVRVRGIFPSSSELQFISSELVDKARRTVLQPHQYNFAPVIIGVDPAWTGKDALEIVMRQGLASSLLRTIPKNDDDFQIASLIAQLEDEYHADAVAIDQGYGTGIYSAGKQMGRRWHLISFANKSPDSGYLNMRAYGWGKMRDWLKDGGAIPNCQELYDDLISPEATVRPDGKIQLESKDSMKKRGLPSPNKGDALALTFMINVKPKNRTDVQRKANTAYNPLG